MEGIQLFGEYNKGNTSVVEITAIVAYGLWEDLSKGLIAVVTFPKKPQILLDFQRTESELVERSASYAVAEKILNKKTEKLKKDAGYQRYLAMWDKSFGKNISFLYDLQRIYNFFVDKDINKSNEAKKHSVIFYNFLWRHTSNLPVIKFGDDDSHRALSETCSGERDSLFVM